MTHFLQATSSLRVPDGLWFAQDPNQDLEFDDGLDDLDDGHPKPPSRRPLLIILLLLIVGAGGYIAMNPDLLTTVKGLIAAPGAMTAEEHGTNNGLESHGVSDHQVSSLPSPIFFEGQVVTVVLKPGEHSPIILTRDMQGNDPGPQVRSGEILTILDGAYFNTGWKYHVNTKSGATGWISQENLKSQS